MPRSVLLSQGLSLNGGRGRRPQNIDDGVDRTQGLHQGIIAAAMLIDQPDRERVVDRQVSPAESVPTITNHAGIAQARDDRFAADSDSPFERALAGLRVDFGGRLLPRVDAPKLGRIRRHEPGPADLYEVALAGRYFPDGRRSRGR